MKYDFSFTDMKFKPNIKGGFAEQHIKLLRLISNHGTHAISKIKNTKVYISDLQKLLYQAINTYIA